MPSGPILFFPISVLSLTKILYAERGGVTQSTPSSAAPSPSRLYSSEALDSPLSTNFPTQPVASTPKTNAALAAHRAIETDTDTISKEVSSPHGVNADLNGYDRSIKRSVSSSSSSNINSNAGMESPGGITENSNNTTASEAARSSSIAGCWSHHQRLQSGVALPSPSGERDFGPREKIELEYLKIERDKLKVRVTRLERETKQLKAELEYRSTLGSSGTEKVVNRSRKDSAEEEEDMQQRKRQRRREEEILINQCKKSEAECRLYEYKSQLAYLQLKEYERKLDRIAGGWSHHRQQQPNASQQSEEIGVAKQPQVMPPQ